VCVEKRCISEIQAGFFPFKTRRDCYIFFVSHQKSLQAIQNVSVIWRREWFQMALTFIASGVSYFNPNAGRCQDRNATPVAADLVFLPTFPRTISSVDGYSFAMNLSPVGEAHLWFNFGGRCPDQMTIQIPDCSEARRVGGHEVEHKFKPVAMAVFSSLTPLWRRHQRSYYY